jgi:hypothetical protein
MHMRRRVAGVSIIIVTTAWLLLSCAEHADACSCIPPGPTCQSAWVFGAVFVGRVVRIDHEVKPYGFSTADPVRVSVEVLEVFRGFEDLSSKPPQAPIEVVTNRGAGRAASLFVEGETYLIYGHLPRGDRSLIRATICSRTREISKADEDLAYLRTLTRAMPEGGRIFGRVEIQDLTVNRPPLGRRPPPEPLRDVPITLTAHDPDAAAVAPGETTTARRWQRAR